MNGTKFIGRTKTALSALLPIAAGIYLIATGTQLDAETVAQLQGVLDQADLVVTGIVAVVGGVGAIYGRLRASTTATALPRLP